MACFPTLAALVARGNKLRLFPSATAGMVGRARVELATSRLSGVRSNHLSYRPILAPALGHQPRLTSQKAIGQLRQSARRFKRNRPEPQREASLAGFHKDEGT